MRALKRLSFVSPMECKEVRRIEDLPQGDVWQYEIKFDGYRAIAIKQDNTVKMFSRKGNSFPQFTNLQTALLEQPPKSFILDGEIVALDSQGKSDFNALQRAKTKSIEAHMFAFDILNLEGRDLRSLPLIERQRVLKQAFWPTEFIHIALPLDAARDVLAEKIREFGFEGIIAKRKDSAYESGKATGAWLKKKIKHSEEFIIGGYEPGHHGVDSIAVGRFTGKEFTYVGIVDDGFVPMTRRNVLDVIGRLKTSKCPFANLPEKEGMHRMDEERMEKTVWVKPKVVVEIAMNEWTPDKHLRHSEFVRLRDDKSPKEIPPYPRNRKRTG